MNRLTVKLYLMLERLKEEHGQDLIEYVLIGGVVALGAVAGMSTFASQVNSAFSNLGTKLGTYTS
jgi:pilus assembly protein Flp/PilA